MFTQFDAVLAGLRAVAEPTRLRMLAILSRGELSVTELTQILGQSQPRVSRHLKLLGERKDVRCPWGVSAITSVGVPFHDRSTIK